MTARVLKWSVPVDDQPHLIGAGPIMHAACQYGPSSVEVWTWEDGRTDRTRQVQAFGTGQPLPDTAGAHVGSAVTAGGNLVWHLFEVTE